LGCNQYDGTLLFEATLTAFGSDGFTLNWTTGAGSAWIIHYMALGGTELTNANVVNWQAPSSAIDKAVTGVGFQPQCAIHITDGASSMGTTTTYDVHWIGAMDGTNEFHVTNYCANAATTTNTTRSQAANYSAYAYTTGLANKLAFKSWDADGFTMTATSTGTRWFITLCLKATNASSFGVGTVDKTTAGAPTTQVITPPNTTSVTGVLYGLNGRVAGSSVYAGAGYHIGASDSGGNNRGIIITSEDALTTSNNRKRCNSSAISLINTFDGVDDAVFTTTSMGTNTFTLSLSTNDALAEVINYVCFSGVANSYGVPAATATTSTASANVYRMSAPCEIGRAHV
jgi:hypothetical protein